MRQPEISEQSLKDNLTLEACILEETKQFDIEAESIKELRKTSIQNLDNVAQSFIESNTRVGTVSGIGTGLVGWAGLLADLPTLFTLSLRTIHQIALCYGYDVYSDEEGDEIKAFEMQYLMQVFKISTAADKVQNGFEMTIRWSQDYSEGPK